MANENDGGADPDADLVVEPVKDGEQVNWEERAKKLEERAAKQRERTAELRGKLKEKEAAEAKAAADKGGKKEESKAGELDKADRFLLRSEKITDEKEVALVQSYMKETGRDAEAVLGSKVFQAELKEMRDLKATEDATPEGAKRSGTQTRDSVDYWLAKGELPPANQPELRRKVVNAKMAQKRSGSQFSDNPIQ